MAAANGTRTAAMLGHEERRISRADRGRWVQLRGVSTASRLLGQCRRSRRRWRRRNLRILWRNGRLYSQMAPPILAGSGGFRRHRLVYRLHCRPIGSFFTTARTNSRAVSLRDWIRLQFRRKKAFSHMRLYQDTVRVEYRQGTPHFFFRVKQKYSFNLCNLLSWQCRHLTNVVVAITRNTGSFSLTIVTCCFCKVKHFYLPFTPWRRYHGFIKFSKIIHPRSLLVSFDENPLS